MPNGSTVLPENIWQNQLPPSAAEAAANQKDADMPPSAAEAAANQKDADMPPSAAEADMPPSAAEAAANQKGADMPPSAAEAAANQKDADMPPSATESNQKDADMLPSTAEADDEDEDWHWIEEGAEEEQAEVEQEVQLAKPAATLKLDMPSSILCPWQMYQATANASNAVVAKQRYAELDIAKQMPFIQSTMTEAIDDYL